MELKQLQLSGLKPHPNQHLLPPRKGIEIEELSWSLAEDGQDQAIHCLADGTIVRGHGRVEAARLLGWTEIEAWIYEEDDEVDTRQVEVDHISDNLNRRHFDDLTIVRCYLAIKDQYLVDDDEQSGDVRDIVAERLGLNVSGRTLSRLIQLTKLPIDIQHMISDKRLNKDHGARLLQLPEPEQQAAIERIRNGEPAKKVLKAISGGATPTSRGSAEVGQRLLSEIQHSIGKLKSSLPELDAAQPKNGDAIQVLDEAIELLTAWRERKVSLRSTSVGELAEAVQGHSRTVCPESNR